jgi:hypothetical protein
MLGVDRLSSLAMGARPSCVCWAFYRETEESDVLFGGYCGRGTVDLACFIWKPGCVFNDLNILNISSTMASILQGKHLPRFTLTVAGKLYSTLYCLADGIYPSWAMFIKTLRKASSPKTRHFSAAQEEVRNDIERAFGVLFSRFHIFKRPCVLRDRKMITSILLTCILMHNMIVESRRDSCESGLCTEAVSK